MAGNALKKIVAEAKRLRRKYPHRYDNLKNPWAKGYMKQASAMYASGHRGKSPVGKKRKKVGSHKRRPVKHRVGAAGVTLMSQTGKPMPYIAGTRQRKRKRHTAKRVARRRVSRVGATGKFPIMPLLAIAGVGLLAYALLKKPATTALPATALISTGNPTRDNTSSQIVAYATAAGLGIDAITKLINSLNNSSDTQVTAVQNSINSGQGIPPDWLA